MPGMRRVVLRAFACLLLAGSATAGAQSSQWVWAAGKQTNDGAIVVKSLKQSGVTINASKNPSGAAVDIRQNAAVQPPVILQTVKKSAPNPWSLYYADRSAGLP